jgi:hypothetical protein
MQYETATDNTLPSFVPSNSCEEKPLWFFMETMPVGKAIEGLLIMRFTDSSEVEQHHGKIVMGREGIMFIEH